MWRERSLPRDGLVAQVASVILTLWATLIAILGRKGVLQARAGEGLPPIAIVLVAALLLLASSLIGSSTLRRLLSRQSILIQLHIWRLLGVVFLILLAQGKVPALWALPAGIGDILVAATAPWIARHLVTARGRSRAITWNLWGMADLIVAIALGNMTSPGAAQVFRTVPTSEILTAFPMVLVPGFLVPLAFTLHVASLWQLLGKQWAGQVVERRGPVRITARGLL
jgi:hypothetical protein